MIETESSATQIYRLVPIIEEHLAAIACWYEDIDELALIESNLPVPVDADTLKNSGSRI
jgi:hypothetical protein